MSDSKQWQPEHFARRRYTLEGDVLDTARRITVEVKVDGKTVANFQCREPGVLAVVSRADEPGLDIDMIEPGGVRFTDYQTPAGENRTLPPAPWQLEAIGLKK